MIPDCADRLPDLWKETYDLVAQVPSGMVTTYGEVAKALGDIAASRFVGLAMSRNDDIVRVPCRRVVQSDGYVGGYTGGGPSKKVRLLRSEGVKVIGSRVLELDRILFDDFKTHYPLKRLRARQRSMKERLDIGRRQSPIEKVAGIDVAYDDDHAYASIVVFDYHTCREIERRVVEGEARFPYVPTYLAFREIPAIRPLMEMVDQRTVIMFDGNGILHPEGFGVTSQIGVAYNVSTVGVAKKLLCGEVSNAATRCVREIRFGGKLVGHAISKDPRGKPVYVSAGHRISPIQARDVALRFLKYRVPEPTRVAHIVAGEARTAAKGK